MNYSKEQVEQYLAAVKKSPGAAQYTPEQWAQYEDHIRSHFGPDAPGGSPATAEEQDLYPSAATRVAAGFADPKTLAKALSSKLKNPQMVNGRMVGQDASGKYVTDATSVLPPWQAVKDAYAQSKDLPSTWEQIQKVGAQMHPINAAEAAVGKLPGAVGWLGGGALGAMGGEAVLPTGGGFAGGTAGAGAGAGTGEALRQMIGRKLGVYNAGSGDALADVGREAGSGALTEAGGRAMGAIPLPDAVGGNVAGAIAKAGDKVLRTARAPVAALSSLVTGVPYKDVQVLMAQPRAVWAAGRKGATQGIAENAAAEAAARKQALGQPVADARAALTQADGSTMLNTNPVIQANQSMLGEAPLNSSGHGKMTPQEINELQSLEAEQLRTPVQMTPITAQQGAEDLATGAQGPTRIVPNGPVQTVDNLPQKSVSDLLGTSDSLDAEINRHWLDNPQAPGLTPLLDRKMVLRGKIKDLVTGMGTPEAGALGSADAAYAAHRAAEGIAQPLANPKTQQSFVENIWGKTKNAQQDALETVAPQTFQDQVVPLRAAQSYANAGSNGALATAKNMAGAGALSAMGYGAMSHSAMPAEVGAATLAGLGIASPTFQKYALGASQMPINGAWWALKQRGIPATMLQSTQLGNQGQDQLEQWLKENAQ